MSGGRKAPVPYDTTLRDGTQGLGVSFSVADKLKIAHRLAAFGIPYIEGGWPGSNPRDAAFFAAARHEDFQGARIAAFSSTRRPHVAPGDDPSLRALVEAGTEVTCLVGKSWDLHVDKALGTTLEENIQMIGSSIAFLKGEGKEVVYDAEHFFDGFRRNRAYAIETLQAAEAAGADWIVLCDTNGGTLPQEVAPIMAAVAAAVKTPLGIHPHDDCGLALAVALEAVRAGAQQVQGTLNGYGERTGNLNLITFLAVAELKLGMSILPPGRLEQITDLSRYVAEVANQALSPSLPFVGERAFAHKGGVHVSAVMREPETYEHVPPQRVGNRRQVVVSDLSGRSNLLERARELGIDARDRARVARLLEEVKRLEHLGYHYEAAEASFELLARRVLEDHVPHFDLVGYHVRVEGHQDGVPLSEATVRIEVRGELAHTVAGGDGPVAALDRALRLALIPAFPEIEAMRLVDYKVRVLDGEEGTGARVRVLIETEDGHGSWTTIGVSDNVIDASYQALSESYEYGLMRRERAKDEGQRVATRVSAGAE